MSTYTIEIILPGAEMAKKKKSLSILGYYVKEHFLETKHK